MPESPVLPDELFLVNLEDAESSGPDARATLSFSRSTTVLLTFAANRFTRHAARLYQDQFGLGAMDWRMLVMLTRAPGCSVAHASKTIGIDKGAVSRSLSRLEKAELAEANCTAHDERRKSWSLTRKGCDLHDQILEVALQRQRELLKGFTVAEVEQFNSFLQRFLGNLEES